MDGFIEIDYADDASPFTKAHLISSLTEGSFIFGKDYNIFDALAGGREAFMRPEDKDLLKTPKFAPRGMPCPQSLQVAQHFFRIVAEPDNPPDEYFWPQHRCISPEIARRRIDEDGALHTTVVQSVNSVWFKAGDRRDATNLKPRIVEHGHVKWHLVAEPYYFNPTWLSIEEFDQSLDHHGLRLDELPVEYSIIRTAMTAIAAKRSEDRVRLVIWFS